MNLTTEAIDAISKNLRVMNLIAAELGCSEITVRRWIEANESDGKLTTSTSLRIIREETGLTDDQILTESQPVHK